MTLPSEERIPITAYAENHDSTSGEISRKRFSTAARIGRSIGKSGIALFASVLMIAVPGLHFILVPAGVLIAILLFVKTIKTHSLILGGSALCPYCNEEFTIVKRKDVIPFMEKCEHCLRESRISLRSEGQ